MTDPTPAAPTPATTPPVIDRWGIQQEWVDSDEQPQRVPDDVVAVVRDLVGEPPADLEETAPVFARRGADLGLGPVRVTCEDGTEPTVDGALPDDAPYGYHLLHLADGASGCSIVSPGTCWLPPERRVGLTAQLYAARSRSSWGIGDLARPAGPAASGPVARAAGSCWSTRCTPSPPCGRRRPAPTCPRPGASATRSTSASRTCRASTRRPRRLRGRRRRAAGRGRGRRAGRPRRGVRRSSAPCCGETFHRTQAMLDADFLRWRVAPGAGRSSSSRRGACCARSTAPTGTTGPSTCSGRAARRWRRTPSSTATTSRFHAWLQWLLELQLRRRRPRT